MHRIFGLILTTLLISACGLTQTQSASPTLDTPGMTNPTLQATKALPSPAPIPSVAPTHIIPSESLPTLNPTAPLSRLAHQLPLDQPWILSGETLIAVSDDGMTTQLDIPVSDVIIAPDGSPLIIARPDANRYILRNTQTWADLPLNIPDRFTLGSGSLLSPNEEYVAVSTWSEAGQFWVMIANSATGGVRPLMSGAGDPIRPLAWQEQRLFTHMQASGTSYFSRTDIVASVPEPQEILVVGHSGPWEMAPNGTALVWNYSGNPLYLRDLNTNIDYILTENPNSSTRPLISPNSKILALQQERESGECCELLFFDLDSRPPTPIGTATQIDNLRSVQGRVGWEWSHDNERLLVVTPLQVSLLNTDGKIFGQAELPSARAIEAFRLTSNDQVLFVTRNGTDVILHSIALTNDEPRSRQEIRLPANEGSYTIVYLPRTK